MHLASWDVETGERIRKHPGHEEVINCMDMSKRGDEMLVSGSDDGYIGVSVQMLSATLSKIFSSGIHEPKMLSPSFQLISP